MKTSRSRRLILCWIVVLFLQAPSFILPCKADCSYVLTFIPSSSDCLELSSADAVSVLVELGNEEQEFVMWGQADLRHPQDGCGKTKLRLESRSECMRGVCQLRLIRFVGDSSAMAEDWLLETVNVETNLGSFTSFNITRPIPADGQVSAGSCVDTQDSVDDYESNEDEVGDIDWS